jgi:hypothetical protein
MILPLHYSQLFHKLNTTSYSVNLFLYSYCQLRNAFKHRMKCYKRKPHMLAEMQCEVLLLLLLLLQFTLLHYDTL